MEYITDIENLVENMPFRATYKDLPIVIYKTRHGIYAVEDRCSHEEYPLSESEAEEDNTIECKRHGSRFDLKTGNPLSLPAVEPVKVFSIIVQEGKIYIE